MQIVVFHAVESATSNVFVPTTPLPNLHTVVHHYHHARAGMYGVDSGAKEEDEVEEACTFTLMHNEEDQHTAELHRLAAGLPWGSSNMVEGAHTHLEAEDNPAVAWHLKITSHLCFAAPPDPSHQLLALA
mmetsp:Transcript_61228/g.126473  ORF Transcript_61228/g.126473 Transcript_61228/m.126473 type:complete len:130 (-) Transcript_61228:772-1161(-)